jgi:hypothetical protein
MNLLREYIREVIEQPIRVTPASQVFCDMDGVLVNFEEAVVDLVNKLLDGGRVLGAEESSKGYRKKLRKLQDELGPDWRAKSRPDLDIKVVRNFMMSAIGSNPGPIFAEMKPWQDALQVLWPFLISTGRRVTILSAPIRGREGAAMTAEEGKELWVSQWLSPSPAGVVMSPAREKQRYATTNDVPNVLIDDKLSTIEAWNAAGGIGVYHKPGGSSATVRELQELGL